MAPPLLLQIFTASNIDGYAGGFNLFSERLMCFATPVIGRNGKASD
jgi:hypothetical protein